VEESDVAKVEESKDGQAQNEGDIDCFLCCKGHYANRFLATGPNHQPAHLQGRSVAFDVVSVREEGTNVQIKNMATSPRQCSGAQCIEHLGFLAKNITAVLEQRPYSLDLAPCDFFIFPNLKGVMKGARFLMYEPLK